MLKTDIQKNFEQREKVLDVMDRVLETRLKIYTNVEDTVFEKIWKMINKFFKSNNN